MTEQTPTAAAAPQNLLGICARVGADFGLNPLWLRLAFATILILNPVAVIAAYFVLGLIVLTSRLVFPSRPSADVVAIGTPVVVEDEVELPLAA